MEGNAIGGLSVGEPAEDMYRIIEIVNEILPDEKPRYLMGVGTPVNILKQLKGVLICSTALCRHAMEETGCSLPATALSI